MRHGTLAINPATIPTAPFLGSKWLSQIPLKAVLPYLNHTALYKMQWGCRKADKNYTDYDHWSREVLDPILRDLVQKVAVILHLQAVYGYFPCHRMEDYLIVYDDHYQEQCRFLLPRQQEGNRLCISDFFSPIDSESFDLVAFQAVTAGEQAMHYERELFASDQYQEYLYFHGFNVEMVEALAEYVHKRIRSELGFAHEDAREISALIKQGYRGSRYSFGYPACPNLMDQDKILSLLSAERIQLTLGEEGQLWPENSTTAIVVHHPEAKYFAV